MHAIELADLTTVFAGLSSDMLALGCVPDRTAGQKYWLESRFRNDFWNSKLASHRQDLQYLSVSNRKRSWLQIIPVIEEVLLSEPLSRCIAYHGRLLMDRHLDSDLSALSQSVLSSHIEARHRCLHLIVFGEGLAVEQSGRLNQLRRIVEGFNDSVLSFLKPIHPADSFSFDTNSVQQAQSTRQHPSKESIDTIQLQLSGLRFAFRQSISQRLLGVAPSPHSNRKLHNAVLSFLPTGLFDSLGVPFSSYTAGLTRQSFDSSPTIEVLADPSAASLGFLFEPHRARSRPASAEEGRW